MNLYSEARNQQLTRRLSDTKRRIHGLRSVRPEGVLKRVVGLTLEATGCPLSIGARVRVQSHEGPSVEAEVVGFSGERVYLASSE